jgi:hypothetical protein
MEIKRMNQKGIERITCVIIIVLFGFLNVFSQKQEQPNIVLFFSDDAGYADFGFTGSKEFKTPNIDELASEGIVCPNAYVSASVCGPSRAGLLSMRYIRPTRPKKQTWIYLRTWNPTGKYLQP